MNGQMAVVLAVVAGCALYAGWALMPAAARRWMARALLRWPLPGFMAQFFRKAAQRAGSACGCDGCDVPPAAAPQEHPIRIHRRPGR